MTATQLLASLRQRGISLEVHGDRLVVTPASQLTEADATLIRQHKPALLLMLLPEDEWQAQLDAIAQLPTPDEPVTLRRIVLYRWPGETRYLAVTEDEDRRFQSRKGGAP